MYYPEMNDSDDSATEIDREAEKLRRRQKLARRGDESEIVNPKRRDRLAPFTKKDRQFNWKTELEEEEEDGSYRDDSDD
jgi:hypothetical protein